MSVQLIHASDLHLDKYFNYSNPERVNQRKLDLNRNFELIVENAMKDRPDLFLISGDVFDRLVPSDPSRIFLTQKIRALNNAGIQVFLIGGNHDVPKSGKFVPLAIDALESAGLATVFSKSDRFQYRILTIKEKSVCVSGKSYNTKNESENPVKGFSIPLLGQVNVLMLHASLRGLGVTPTIPEMATANPLSPQDLPDKLDYLALGHFHNHFERMHNGCQICNPGSIERLDWSELKEEKGYYWADLGTGDPKVEFVKLPTRPMERLEFTLDRKMQDQLKQKILGFLGSYSNPEKIVSLILNGSVTQRQYSELLLNEIYQETKDMFFQLDIERDLEVEGFGRLASWRFDTPREAFAKRLDTLIANANDNERPLLMRVKELGEKYLAE